MTSEADPIIDAWYHHPEKAQKFKVTALDDHAATVEIQYFDGNIDELDLDTCTRQLAGIDLVLLQELSLINLSLLFIGNLAFPGWI